MPTYDYECRKCGHRFEKFQSITAPSLKTCPKCKGKVARLITGGAGIIFKGSGFYQTDYKKTSHASHATEKKTEVPKTDNPPAKPAK
ncbi:MAG: FmdB family zinc ribbon protein [Kiritimatiellia bacterium]